MEQKYSHIKNDYLLIKSTFMKGSTNIITPHDYSTMEKILQDIIINIDFIKNITRNKETGCINDELRKYKSFAEQTLVLCDTLKTTLSEHSEILRIIKTKLASSGINKAIHFDSIGARIDYSVTGPLCVSYLFIIQMFIINITRYIGLYTDKIISLKHVYGHAEPATAAAAAETTSVKPVPEHILQYIKEHTDYYSTLCKQLPETVPCFEATENTLQTKLDRIIVGPIEPQKTEVIAQTKMEKKDFTSDGGFGMYVTRMKITDPIKLFNLADNCFKLFLCGTLDNCGDIYDNVVSAYNIDNFKLFLDHVNFFEHKMFISLRTYNVIKKKVEDTLHTVSNFDELVDICYKMNLDLPDPSGFKIDGKYIPPCCIKDIIKSISRINDD